ncbi:MAG: nucleotidyltransferase family protein, partial [Oscillospiraceae bacterium]|nr:nucleotidyltransferase family protein [Oscillospiraceae bacterium]
SANDSRDVLSCVWEDAREKTPGSFQRCMSDEMFYFHHMAHMAKHFETGGCGIRPFLDVWILTHRKAHDRKKREELLRKGGLLTFAQAVEQTAEVWFSGVGADAVTKQIGDYILRAGIYGNRENRAAIGQAKMGGKLRYVLLRRVFMPYEYLKAEYPVLEKHRWLFPFYQFVRWGRMLFGGGLSRTAKELKANAGSSDEMFANAAELLERLGL